MLVEIKNYLRAGRICEKGLSVVQYDVRSLKDLEIVIAHFKKHKLITKKRGDFELMCEILNLIKLGEHFTPEGLRKIVAIRAAMN